MASAVSGSGLSVIKKYAEEVGEVIFTDLFEAQELTSVHAVDTGIKVKAQIPIYGGLIGNVGKQGKTCDLSVATNVFALSEKEWNPKTYSDRFSECYTDLNNTVWEAMISENANPADLTQVESFLNYFVGGVVNAFQLASWREAWFADTAIKIESAGGVLNNAVDVAYYNKLDGFWKQIASAVTANPTIYMTGSILATRNAGASSALQQFTSTDVSGQVVTKLIMSMKSRSNILLRKKQGLEILVTQSVFDQVLDELVWLNASFDKVDVIDGRETVKVGGHTLIAISEWDRLLGQDFVQANGTIFNPHRIVFTYKDNLRIGTPAIVRLDPMTNTLFYDQKDRKLYLDVELALDAKLIEDKMLVVAY